MPRLICFYREGVADIAGKDNLIGKGFDSRGAEEARRCGKIGAQKSAETRRKKANLKKTFEMLAQMKIAPDEMSERLEIMGLDPTGENAIAMAMMLQAMSGDVKAFAQVAKYLGQDEHIKAQIEETKERARLIKKQREELETKDEPEQFADDGFIEALKGTAASDWAEYKDDVENETEE